eukprot:2298212-Amphidinium_carterae.1
MQACAYKTGEIVLKAALMQSEAVSLSWLKTWRGAAVMQDLRTKAEEKLGTKFDLKAFHNVILDEVPSQRYSPKRHQ